MTSKPEKPSKTDPVQILLTVAQFAKLNAVSERTVRREIAAGLIKVTRMGPSGHMVRIHPDALEAYRRRREG